MNYEEIRDIIIKKYVKEYGYAVQKRETRNYHKSGYVVFKDNSITINSHIDLEVARTTFTFADDGILKDIDVTGWY